MYHTQLSRALLKITNSAPQKLTPLTTGSFTSAERWLAELEDGRKVFVKQSKDQFTRDKLYKEYSFYHRAQGDFIPKFIGWLDGPQAILVREDVEGSWPPPWTSSMITDFNNFLTILGTFKPNFPLERIDDIQDMHKWESVSHHQQGLSELLGIPADWIAAAIPILLKWEQKARVKGNNLVHLDIRGDNICFTNQGVKLIDWDHACLGNTQIDKTMWLINLALEEGPDPWEQSFMDIPITAVLAGFFLHDSLTSSPSGLDPKVRTLQREQARVALQWLSRTTELGRFPD